MKDVTGQMQRFKEASRHIWNSYLMPGEGVLDMAVEDSFLQIERELLRSIVLEGSAAADQYGHSAIGGLIVKPKPLLREVPVQFARAGSDGNSYWSEDERIAAADIPKLEFVDFFDWTHYGYIDYAIVRAVESGSGRRVLIQALYCDFWWDGIDGGSQT
ncbi:MULTISPECIES: hypothetical protein [Stenotrophomonas]|jgi:hypothetical protein|uniref:Uncharacterized protein n=1 Tax=Stenotrophomonas rhizophila TaxID=216778 RepID=A0AAP5E9G5_9GAMM|nr:hypothetical protein [Stenotrophomonas rhizophila]MDQ1107675.1 hypothetical protein [Stenotrophomonas rhizophila]UQY86853.1 hypothetical protein LQE85_15385 [Stenotrophomonas rhizophila]